MFTTSCGLTVPASASARPSSALIIPAPGQTFLDALEVVTDATGQYGQTSVINRLTCEKCVLYT